MDSSFVHRRSALARLAAGLFAASAFAGCETEIPLGSIDVLHAEASTIDAVADVSDAPHVDASPSVSCATASDCRVCGALPGCGWCGARGVCVSGTSAGPAGGDCGAETWVWDPATCPATHCEASTCDGCLAQDGCGWCGTTGRCVAGTRDGAFGGACSGSWAWLGAQCPGGCSAGIGTCSQCQTRSGCGWCSSTERCVAENTDGSAPTTDSCPASDWVPSFGVCPVETDRCTVFGTCIACMDPMAGAAGCGWCSSRGTSGRCVTNTAGNCPSDAWATTCPTGSM